MARTRFEPCTSRFQKHYHLYLVFGFGVRVWYSTVTSVPIKRAVFQHTAEDVSKEGWQLPEQFNFAKGEIRETKILRYKITCAKNYSALKMEAVYSSGSLRTTLYDFIAQITIGATITMSTILYGLFPVSEEFPKVHTPSSLTLWTTSANHRLTFRYRLHIHRLVTGHFHTVAIFIFMNNYSDNWYVLLNRNTAAAIQVRICRNWSGARGAAKERAICMIRSAARRSETNIGVYHIDIMDLKCVDILTCTYALGLYRYLFRRPLHAKFTKHLYTQHSQGFVAKFH